jgi:DNA-binding NarL/FixJ family response regulator
MLSNRHECTVVGQVGDEETEVALDVYRPDMLLWDLGRDPAAELESLGRVQNIDVVGLLPDESQTGEAWSAGLRGLLLRDVAVDALVSAITTVSQGMVVLDPGLAEAVLPSMRQRDDRPVEHLTHRELEVLRLLA